MIKEKEIYYFISGIFVWVPSMDWKNIFSQYNSLRNFHVCDVISVLSNDLIYKTCWSSYTLLPFTMSSIIKKDLLNLQKYLLVGETSPSSTKASKQMPNKYQKTIGHLSSCDWEILNTLTEDELSSALIYQLRIIQKDWRP